VATQVATQSVIVIISNQFELCARSVEQLGLNFLEHYQFCNRLLGVRAGKFIAG
jgi:hypothetical protein